MAAFERSRQAANGASMGQKTPVRSNLSVHIPVFIFDETEWIKREE